MFELTKAKMESRKAKRLAIVEIDKYINILSTSLPAISDVEQRRVIETEIKELVGIKEVYKRYTELPGWFSELISTALKICTLIVSVVACEKVTNAGTGDRIVTDAMRQMPKM